MRAEASHALRSLRIDAQQLVRPLLHALTASPIGTGELRAYGLGTLISSAEPILREVLLHHTTAPRGGCGSVRPASACASA